MLQINNNATMQSTLLTDTNAAWTTGQFGAAMAYQCKRTTFRPTNRPALRPPISISVPTCLWAPTSSRSPLPTPLAARFLRDPCHDVRHYPARHWHRDRLIGLALSMLGSLAVAIPLAMASTNLYNS